MTRAAAACLPATCTVVTLGHDATRQWVFHFKHPGLRRLSNLTGAPQTCQARDDGCVAPFNADDAGGCLTEWMSRRCRRPERSTSFTSHLISQMVCIKNNNTKRETLKRARAGSAAAPKMSGPGLVNTTVDKTPRRDCLPGHTHTHTANCCSLEFVGQELAVRSSRAASQPVQDAEFGTASSLRVPACLHDAPNHTRTHTLHRSRCHFELVQCCPISELFVDK